MLWITSLHDPISRFQFLGSRIVGSIDGVLMHDSSPSTGSLCYMTHEWLPLPSITHRTSRSAEGCFRSNLGSDRCNDKSTCTRLIQDAQQHTIANLDVVLLSHIFF